MKIKTLLIWALKGFLAGLCIGVGGLLYLTCITYIPAPYGKILGSLLFPVGLFTICSFSLLLFTGKIGLIFEKRQEKDYYISLPIMYVFNLIGAALMGFLCYLIFQNTDIFLKVSELANNRLIYNNAGDVFGAMFKAFLCGLCVYFAVKSYALDKNKIRSVILLFFFIAIFVYLGFEHCIANMYYFAFAKFPSINVLYNMLIVTAGNIIGTIPGVFFLKAVRSE